MHVFNFLEFQFPCPLLVTSKPSATTNPIASPLGDEIFSRPAITVTNEQFEGVSFSVIEILSNFGQYQIHTALIKFTALPLLLHNQFVDFSIKSASFEFSKVLISCPDPFVVDCTPLHKLLDAPSSIQNMKYLHLLESRASPSVVTLATTPFIQYKLEAHGRL
jgi:hypothetical protein